MRIISIFVQLLFVILLFSCEKHEINNAKPENVVQIITNHFIKNKNVDPEADVLISSVKAVSLLDTNDVIPQVIFQANSLNRQFVGDVYFNEMKIPFNYGYYYIDFNNSQYSNVEILGKDSKVEIFGSSEFSGLRLIEYCPQAIKYRFEGIIDRNRYNLDGFDIIWDVDSKNIEEPILIIISAENREGVVTKLIECEETKGKLKLEADVLSQFSGYDVMHIYVARGKSQIIWFNQKMIRFTVINYTWSKLFR